jgi:hypothetical protein
MYETIYWCFWTKHHQGCRQIKVDILCFLSQKKTNNHLNKLQCIESWDFYLFNGQHDDNL